MSFFNELNRRNVFRVAIAYIVMAWLVMQVADVILNNIAAPGWVFQVILLLLAIGFLLALFFAWVFEMTPEGLKRESEVDRSQSITHETGQKLNYMIIAVLVLALGYFAYDKFVLSTGREATAVELAVEEATSQRLTEQADTPETTSGVDNSIAVLPFVNMSSDEEQEYFSDGLSEELLNLLAKIPELRVTSRSSAFAFKGEKIDIPEVARKLNVAHILEGSVRKAGKQVRVTAQLIDARSDIHLWSETYDRTLDDIFAIQDEIASTVVKQLKITLLGSAPHVQETNPEAYALYLQARHLSRVGTNEADEQAIGFYKQALSIDPDYASAWVGLSVVYINQVSSGVVPADKGYSLSREMIQKALTIDPQNALAQAGLGTIAMSYANSLEEAAPHYERALALDPGNHLILNSASSMLQSLGRLEQTIAIREHVSALDPVSAGNFYNVGTSYLFAGRYADAIRAFETSLRLSPGNTGASYHIGVALLMQGDAEAALKAFAEESGDDEYRIKGLAMANFSLGRQEEFTSNLDQLIKGWGEQWPSEVAHVYAWTGDPDLAFSWLEKAIEQNEEGLAQQFLVPFFRSLEKEPRWAVFLERVGCSPGQLDAIKFEVTLPR